MNLIDKDALVAEIGTLIANGKFKCQQSQENGDYESYVAWSEHIAACGKILSFVNTLEVKDVELDKHQIADIIQNLFPTDQFIESETLLLDKEDAIIFAKHFFELRLQAQKGN